MNGIVVYVERTIDSSSIEKLTQHYKHPQQIATEPKLTSKINCLGPVIDFMDKIGFYIVRCMSQVLYPRICVRTHRCVFSHLPQSWHWTLLIKPYNKCTTHVSDEMKSSKRIGLKVLTFYSNEFWTRAIVIDNTAGWRTMQMPQLVAFVEVNWCWHYSYVIEIGFPECATNCRHRRNTIFWILPIHPIR